MAPMAVTALRWAYRRLGRLYPRIFLVLELQTVYPVILGTYGLFSFYYDGTTGEFFALFGITCGLAAIAIVVACLRTFPMLKPLEAWIAGARDDRSTTEAWAAAISFPWRMIRSNVFVPASIVLVPSAVISVVTLELSWTAVFPFVAGATVALAYASMLHYFALEIGLRPLLIDINQQVSPRTEANVSTISLRWRLLLTLPMINAITGMTVAALTSEGGGGTSLGLDVGIALGVATTIALELTLLVTRSVLRPIADLQAATERVLAGDFSVSVPVTTGDETGELAASFNAMVQGLQERERIRDAFGTYLDQEVAEYILSDSFDEEGIEVEVSVLFTDVRNFTAFAADSDAKEVVASLNELFEVVVPVISRHGGHVDKFEGDGLLAVFGAPRPFSDHAERAARAAIEICHRVNQNAEAGALRVGVGVNTGRVLAGAVGGGGRLNFSVIGDAVNIAARVEAATRELDRDVLITDATAAALGPSYSVSEVGPYYVKGLQDPIELYSVEKAGSQSAAEKPADDGPLLDPEPILSAAGKVRRTLLRRDSN
jgi:adenylate cyclase